MGKVPIKIIHVFFLFCKIFGGNEAIIFLSEKVPVSYTHLDVLQAMGKTVFTLADVMSAPVNGSGYHDKYGMLGSNKATEEKLKLFPRNCQPVVDSIQARIAKERGLRVEVMVYGDGAFKDPVGGIWELADPVVSPAYTAGLAGKPNELKLKFLRCV